MADMKSSKEVAEALRLSLQSRVNSTSNLTSSETTKCADCEGGGFKLVEKNGSRRAQECHCVAERRVVSRLPLRYQKASLLDFSGPTREFIVDWISKPGDGLLITGPVGSGKTHLAAACCRTLILIHQEAFFQRCADLYKLIRETYRTNMSEESVIEASDNRRFVFLDDLGSGSLSDHERRVTLEILDRRLNRILPTCVTTNWSLEEISERMDDRISSRLQSFTQLKLDGRDRRAS